jgi:hypothetical protein
MNSRVIQLDGAGDGVVGLPPARYAGCSPNDGSLTITNMGRTLPATGEVLPVDEKLVGGDVVIAGAPDSTAVIYFRCGR